MDFLDHVRREFIAHHEEGALHHDYSYWKSCLEFNGAVHMRIFPEGAFYQDKVIVHVQPFNEQKEHLRGIFFHSLCCSDHAPEFCREDRSKTLDSLIQRFNNQITELNNVFLGTNLNNGCIRIT